MIYNRFETRFLASCVNVYKFVSLILFKFLPQKYPLMHTGDFNFVVPQAFKCACFYAYMFILLEQQ